MIAIDGHHDLLARALGVDLADPIAKSRFRAMVLQTPRLGQWISGCWSTSRLWTPVSRTSLPTTR